MVQFRENGFSWILLFQTYKDSDKVVTFDDIYCCSKRSCTMDDITFRGIMGNFFSMPSKFHSFVDCNSTRNIFSNSFARTRSTFDRCSPTSQGSIHGDQSFRSMMVNASRSANSCRSCHHDARLIGHLTKVNRLRLH